MIQWGLGAWCRTRHVNPKLGVTAGRPVLERTVARMTHLRGEICLASIVTATTFTIGAKLMEDTVLHGIHDGAAFRISLVRESQQPRLAVVVVEATAHLWAILNTIAPTYPSGKMWRPTLVKCMRTVRTAQSEVATA